MSNYTVTTNFAAKDALPSGNPSKLILGAQLTTEFTNIASAIATKLDSSSGVVSVTGTANQVTASTVSGAVTLTLPQNLVVPTPSSGVALTVTGLAGQPGTLVQVPATASNGAIQIYDSTNAAIRGYIGGRATITGQGVGDLAIAPGASGNVQIGRAVGSAIGTTFGANGNVVVAAPSSGTPLSITGVASSSTIVSLTAGASGGAGISANDGTGTFIFGSGILASGVWSVYDSTHAAERFKIASSGAVTINAPSSGGALTINGVSSTGIPALTVAGGTSNARGLLVTAGSSSAEFNSIWANQTNTTNFMLIYGDGGVVLGAPTGGDQGLGTLNATGLFINGVAAGATTGSFTATLATGGTTTPTVTCKWTKIGNTVTLRIVSGVTYASNATGMTVTGIPAAIQPTTGGVGTSVFPVINNLSTNTAFANITGGTMTLSISTIGTFSSGGFTASGTKGLPDTTIVWDVN